MAEEFQLGSGNWWETSRNRSYDSGTTPPASISTTLNAMASFGWPTEMVDMKPRESGTAALHGGGGGGGGGGLANPNLQVMGLGLSSQGMDWNQALLGEKAEGSFKSMLEEDSSSNSSNFQQQQWRQKQYFSVDNDFKQIDQPHFSSSESTITSQNLTTSFPVDAAAAAAAYGMLFSENHQHNASQPMSYPYSSSGGYGVLRQSPPPPLAFGSNTAHLHFTNNTPFWNAMTNARPSFQTASQAQIPLAPSFDEKPKITSEVQNLSTTTKKNSTETSNKRARNEASSPLPPFKVRKEKMGDRITALQQLVSPFGKTDTASVLSEAIEYIKFLHEQVSALSAPYMRNGAPIQHQQNSEKSKDQEGPRQDLRSRGLCLVPVSSTFPMTHETTVDFWTPTFGGSFR